jgi:hypothetical protein
MQYTGTSNSTYSSTAIDVSATSSSIVCKSQFSEAASHDEGNEMISNANGQILESSNLEEFTFADLKRATKNFKSDTLLGEGGFGKVYKGWIDQKTYAPSKSGSGMVVAIKKLNSGSMQGLEEWQVFSILNFNCLNIQESYIWAFNSHSVIKFHVFVEFVTNP